MTALLLVAALGTLLGLGAVVRLGRLRETHHLYYGIVLVLLGVLLGWGWLVVIGTVVLWDDTIQHLLQLRWPASRYSLLFWLYAKTIARIPFVQRLNEWLDARP